MAKESAHQKPLMDLLRYGTCPTEEMKSTQPAKSRGPTIANRTKRMRHHEQGKRHRVLEEFGIAWQPF
eukprot:2679077-Amphidinium_carterae.1